MSYEVVKLKYLSQVPITNGLGLPGEHDNPEWPRYIRTTDIASPTSLRDDVFASQPPDVASKARVSSGDILMTAVGATIGKSVRLTGVGDACYAGFLVRYRPINRVDGRFVAYWMQSQHYWDQISVGAVRSTIDNFSASKYREMQVPLPPVEEQRRIADFLDDHVTRIDELAVLRRVQLDLVTERRIAALDSVIETISARSVQLRRFLRPRQSVGHETETVLSLYRDLGVVPKADRSDNFNKTPEDLTRYQLVLAGDFVVNKMKAWSGSVAVSDWRGIVSPDYQVCEIVGDVSPRYLHHVMRSARAVNEMRRLSRGIRPNQERLYWDDLGGIRMPVPDRSKQDAVAQEIDTAIGAFEEQRQPFLESVGLLEERKRALITAAVTGELDVTTAKPIGVGKWAPNIGAGVEAPAAAQASSIGGIG